MNMNKVRIENELGEVKDYDIECLFYSFEHKKHYLVCSDENKLYAFKFSSYEKEDYEFVNSDEELEMIRRKMQDEWIIS